MTVRAPVGFSQRIQLRWLDLAVELQGRGEPAHVIRAELQELLRDKLSLGGAYRHSNREKAVSIVMRTWVTVPGQLRDLRDAGLHHWRGLPEHERVVAHWCMAAAVYPFFAHVAATTGRLARLQDKVSTAEVLRRLEEQYGERPAIRRAAQRILRCFADWGVLEAGKAPGEYVVANLLPVTETALATWMLEAVLHGYETSRAEQTILRSSPVLFPFRLGTVTSGDLTRADRLEVVRQGSNEAIIALRD